MKPSYVLTELRRRPRRSVAAILSLAFGVALFLSLQAYSNGYRVAARAPLASIGADIAVQRQGKLPQAFEGILFPHSTAPIHRADIDAIRHMSGVEDIGEAVFFWDFEKKDFKVVLGLDPGSRTGPARLGTAVVNGRFLQPQDKLAAVADDTFASHNGLTVGSQTLIAGQAFVVVGLVDTSRIGQVANANLYIPVDQARDLASRAKNVLAVHDFRPDDANILFVKADQAKADAISSGVTALMGKDALVSSNRSFIEVLGQAFSLVDQFSWLVGLAALIVALVGLFRSLTSALRERRRDIGLMRAVGWTRRNVAGQLVSEALSLALLGALVGLGLALAVSSVLGLLEVNIPVPWELSPTPHFLAGGAVPMGVTIHLSAVIEPLQGLLAVGAALACGLVVGLGIAYRATKIRPAEVLRNE